MAVRPTHFEFYSNDPEATVKFLAKAFGWAAQRWGDEDYWLLDTGDRQWPRDQRRRGALR